MRRRCPRRTRRGEHGVEIFVKAAYRFEGEVPELFDDGAAARDEEAPAGNAEARPAGEEPGEESQGSVAGRPPGKA